VAAEYEVNIKINSRQIERELKNIDKIVSNIGKPKGGGARRKPGIAGLLPSSADLKATERGLVQLNAKTKAIQSIQDKFSERRLRSLTRSNTLNEKELRLNKQLTAEARARLRLLSQAGAKGFDGTRPQGRQLANDINARVKAQDKRARLLNKINEMEAKGLNVEKLRKQLNKATTEQSARRFASADKEFNLLRKTIELEQAKLRILKEQRRNFPSSPIRGTATMMGSPAQIAASGRQIASPIGGGLGFPGSPGFLAGATASRTPFGPSFPTGGAALPVKGSITMPGSPIAVQAAKKTNLRALKVEATWAKALGQLQETAGVLKSRDGKVKRSWNIALETLQDTAKLIRVRSQQAAGGLTGQSSPIGGAANIPGSPAALKRGRRNKRLGQVGLGAGFPLLFGGGPGSVLGGAAGGLTGSFGAQIALSALGQQIDQMVASVINAGKAFTNVGGAADFMAEKSLFSSDSMQFRIEKLIEEGKVTEAAALMTQEMAKQVGGSGLKALKDLGTEASKMGKLFGTLLIRIQAFMASALTPLLKLINSAIGNINARSQLDQMLREAESPEQKAQILQRSKELRGTVKQGRAGTALGKLTPEIIAQLQQDFPAAIPEGAAIEPKGLELLRAGDKGFDKAAKDAERLARRLAGLDAERDKLEQLLQLDQQINTAKLQGDNRQVIALENEARLIAFAEKEAVIRASKVPQEQKIAELKNLGLEKDRALLENAFKLDSFDKQKADDLTLQLEQLDLQLEAATAITREAENQAKLELLLLNLRESNKDLTDDQLKELMDKTKKLFEAQNQGSLQSFITNSVKSLNDLEQHAVQVSQGIGNAIGNSLVSGMQGLITGATSVKQVFADMLKSIADVLAQQAAQMIATYIAIGIARAFAGMGGGESSASAPASKVGSAANLPGPTGDFGLGAGPSFGSVSDFKPATILPAAKFAQGGFVSSPTSALIGEGGEPEYIIPASKMRESMSRYSRGSRGGGVIPSDGGSSASGDGGVAVAAPIDVRYTVERINSVDYVTADQFQSGMQSAAAEGAQRGEQNTLKRLQMSGSTRRRLGM